MDRRGFSGEYRFKKFKRHYPAKVVVTLRSVPDWLQPIQRGRGPTATAVQRGGRLTFERAVERFAENHISQKNGRPYSRTSRNNIRGNLLGGPLRLFRQRAEIVYIEDWTDANAAEYLRWLQYEMGRDSATIKKVRSQLRQLAAYCAEHLGAPAAVGDELGRLRVSSAPDVAAWRRIVGTRGRPGWPRDGRRVGVCGWRDEPAPAA